MDPSNVTNIFAEVKIPATMKEPLETEGLKDNQKENRSWQLGRKPGSDSCNKGESVDLFSAREST